MLLLAAAGSSILKGNRGLPPGTRVERRSPTMATPLAIRIETEPGVCPGVGTILPRTPKIPRSATPSMTISGSTPPEPETNFLSRANRIRRGMTLAGSPRDRHSWYLRAACGGTETVDVSAAGRPCTFFRQNRYDCAHRRAKKKREGISILVTPGNRLDAGPVL